MGSRVAFSGQPQPWVAAPPFPGNCRPWAAVLPFSGKPPALGACAALPKHRRFRKTVAVGTGGRNGFSGKSQVLGGRVAFLKRRRFRKTVAAGKGPRRRLPEDAAGSGIDDPVARDPGAQGGAKAGRVPASQVLPL